MKRILVVYYSQTGQLTRALKSVTAPLANDGEVQVTWQALRSEPSYPFPWSFYGFLDAFPESVLLDPPKMAPFDFDPDERFDLVILAYTVWFLSPSLPVTGFLKSREGQQVLKDTPVITLITCRNMWMMAQEKVKKLLAQAGARLTDNIVMVDQGNSLATFFTTPRWMLTGRKDRMWGIFPPAGVSEEVIAGSARFGEAVSKALKAGTLDGSRPVLTGLGAVEVDDRLIASEKIANRSFSVWAPLIRRFGPPRDPRRIPALTVYVAFLITMLIAIVPLSMAVRMVLRPLMKARIVAQRAYFEGPSGSGRERLAETS